MKRFSVFKVIQLSILIIMSLISVFLLLRPAVKQYVFSSVPATVLFVVIWVILIVDFIFILIDLKLISSMKSNYHSLYGVAYSDPLSGIPNRFSCDVLIEKYIDSRLPDGIGCVMIDFTNLPDINNSYSHAVGNRTIKEFSDILFSCSLSLCFVGRNGGNKFLAIFEDCTQEKVNSFLRKVQDRVAYHNKKQDSVRIDYRAGSALNSAEHLSSITELIALANRRIYETT